MAAYDLGTAAGAGDAGSSQLQDAAPSLSQYDLLSTQFKAPEFIAFAGPLTDRTALDYFSQSPFYDKRCTNQMLRMQNIAAFASTLGRWSAREEEEQLRRFVGIEYVVANAQPPALFVIHRRERVSETEAYVQAAYYIINDAIMQAPDLLTMLSNRLHMAMHFIGNSLDLARKARPALDLRASAAGGAAWKVFQPMEDEAEDASAAATAGASAAAGTGTEAAAAGAESGDVIMDDVPGAGSGTETGRRIPDATLKRPARGEAGAATGAKEDKRVRIAANQAG